MSEDRDIYVEYLTKEVPPEHLDEDGNDIYAYEREHGLPIIGSGFDCPMYSITVDAPLCRACKNQLIKRVKTISGGETGLFICKKLGKEGCERESEEPFKYECKEFEADKESFVYDVVMEKLKERRK